MAPKPQMTKIPSKYLKKKKNKIEIPPRPQKSPTP